MARVLIVGCGGRGRALARALVDGGHVVRGTSRSASARAAIEDAGAEFYRGDPDRIGTLMAAMEAVTVLCWLMGSATGPDEQVAALHDGRLRMLLEKSVDTPVRGIVYEAAGSVPAAALERGASLAEWARETWEIPVRTVRADPRDREGWTAVMLAAVEALLAPAPWMAGAAAPQRPRRP